MNTDDMIERLVQDGNHGWRLSVWRSLTVAMLAGGALAFALLLMTLRLRPDWAQAIGMPMVWVKMGFTLTLAAAGFVAVRRVSTPGLGIKTLPFLLAAPVVGVWAVALFGIRQVPAAEVPDYVLGSTWSACALLIAMLSVPIFVCVLWVMRRLAVTRPTIAGGVAGLFSGAMAASVYGLHCPEVSPAFVGIWYVLGILIPTLTGLLIGRRVLSW